MTNIIKEMGSKLDYFEPIIQAFFEILHHGAEIAMQFFIRGNHMFRSILGTYDDALDSFGFA